MEELFRIDNAHYQCGCCPDLRSSNTSSTGGGLLGLRVLTEQQKGSHRSSITQHGKTGPHDYSAGGERIRLAPLFYSESVKNEVDEEEGDFFEEVEPSTLHKYSAGMKESKFSYIQEDEPLIPSFNLNIS